MKKLDKIKMLLALLGILTIVAVPVYAGRAPERIGTTLAFDDGKVVTIQYSQNYFCDSAGPATSDKFSPCLIGKDAVVDPVPDVASNELDVIIPVFLGTSTDGGIFDPRLGANNVAQCPDTITTLKCINHPAFTTNAATGVVSPVPIHSHIISGNGVPSAQGGWWKLKVFAVTDSSIWPDPKTGSCSAGSGCLTSKANLDKAVSNKQVAGPIITNIYLFFNVVGSNAK